MLTVTLSRLRNNAREYFDRMEQGETIRISWHGRPVALLTPCRKEGAGRMGRRKPLRIDRVSLSLAIVQDRDGQDG